MLCRRAMKDLHRRRLIRPGERKTPTWVHGALAAASGETIKISGFKHLFGARYGFLNDFYHLCETVYGINDGLAALCALHCLVFCLAGYLFSHSGFRMVG